jgi:hypothetical protein
MYVNPNFSELDNQVDHQGGWVECLALFLRMLLAG